MATLDWIYLQNSVRSWLWALGAAGFVGIALRAVTGRLSRRFEAWAAGTGRDSYGVAAALLKRTNALFFLAVAAFAGSSFLVLPAKASSAARVAAVLALLVQLGAWLDIAVDYWVRRYAKISEGKDATGTVTALGFLGKILVWSAIALLALENLGVKVTTLIAGLGLGGIAVALAVQNVLGDLFASLSIVLDKPFVVGDFIAIDSYLGTVEYIGLKTTRIRSLSGEQIVFSNADLLKSRIRNYKRMYERRVAFSFGVAYGTPTEKLEAIPSMVREIVEKQPLTRFDRAHFAAFGEWSLNFEVVYYVLTPDYNAYMDIQQNINLGIHRRFKEEGIEIAYPTRVVRLDSSLPLTTRDMR